MVVKQGQGVPREAKVCHGVPSGAKRGQGVPWGTKWSKEFHVPRVSVTKVSRYKGYKVLRVPNAKGTRMSRYQRF